MDSGGYRNKVYIFEIAEFHSDIKLIFFETQSIKEKLWGCTYLVATTCFLQTHSFLHGFYRCFLPWFEHRHP